MTGTEKRQVWNQALDAAIMKIRGFSSLSDDEKQIVVNVLANMRK